MGTLLKAEVATGSQFVMWWLTGVRGYRLVRTLRTPKQAMFGQIVYKNIWWLEKNQKEEESEGR